KTVGPIDGHDLPTLIGILSEVRDFPRPIVLHVKTVKGKGYSFCEADASKFHSPPAFEFDTPEEGEPAERACRVELKSEGRSFTAAFSDAMLALLARDPKVVACTAAMPDGTGLTKSLAAHADRVWDTGICESHALDMMAGLAKTGFRPFFAVYSTFFQRAFDQAFQEASLQGLAVRLCLDRAGLVGGDGAVHHGFCDTALLRTLPGAVITAAIDEPSLLSALEFMRTHDESLSSVRYPRDVVSARLSNQPCPPFALGKARLLTPEIESPDAAVLAFGTPALTALDAVEQLKGEYRVEVYDARFAKPVDAALVRRLIENGTPIITVEDHSVVGGFGSAVLESAQEMGLSAAGVTRLGLPDSFIHQDSRAKQLAEAGLDAASIARAIRESVLRRADSASASAASPPLPAPEPKNSLSTSTPLPAPSLQ
ncbi:MAG: 1-deoxy-D-xylulose-5-phosphate synthase, partial [Phycisphaerae bacterium]|nr:1-deoxy-D-xylulose-5-phosphate synthase [Phycisphaerae bacterium]